MTAQNEKLDRFIEAVKHEIDKEVEKILENAVETREKYIETSSDETLSIAYDKINDDTKRICAKYVRLSSRAELDAKRELLIYREGLTNTIFDNLEKRIAQFSQSDEYEKFLLSSVEKEIAKFNGEESAIIYIREQDSKFSQAIGDVIKGKGEIQVNPKIKLGGIEVYCPSKKQIIDKTLDSELLHQREEFNQSGCLKI